MAEQGGLGKDFDVLHMQEPIDLKATSTGARIDMKNYNGVCFVGYLTNGTAAEEVTFTLKEHTAATGGTSTALATVATYYTKSEATLDGDEAWTKVTQTAASTVTDATWDDELQVLVCFEVTADEMSDGYEWLSIDIADPGTAHLGAVLAIGYGLRVQRTPGNLAQPNA